MLDELAPVDITTLQERVYQSLRAALLKGQFRPGQAVSIRSLAAALGTSPMPVREATKRLVAERALDQATDRRLRVAPYDAGAHQESVRIRVQIEGFATEKACAGDLPLLVDRLKAHNNAMLKALQAFDVDETLSGNQAFHFEIYQAAGYPQLLEIISSLWLRTDPIFSRLRSDRDRFRRVFEIGYDVHNEAIEALSRGDREAARRAIALDIRSGHFWGQQFYKSTRGLSAELG